MSTASTVELGMAVLRSCVVGRLVEIAIDVSDRRGSVMVHLLDATAMLVRVQVAKRCRCHAPGLE